MRTNYLLLFIFILFGFTSKGQFSSIDSLKSLAAAENVDSIRYGIYDEITSIFYNNSEYELALRFLNEKSAELQQDLGKYNDVSKQQIVLKYIGHNHHSRAACFYRVSKNNLAWAYLDSAQAIFIQLKALKDLAKLYNLKGILFYYDSLLDSALANYQKSNELARIVADTGLIASTTANRAGILKRQQKYDEAIALYLEVKKLGELRNDKLDIGDAYKGLGDVHYYKKLYNKAIEYYSKAITIFRELDDLRGLELCLANIALVYVEQGEYDAALRNQKQSLEISKKRKFQKGTADSYISIGKIFSNMNKLDSAIYYYRKALNLHLKIEYKPGYAMAYANLGTKLIEIDSIQKGINYLQKSVALYRELKDNFDLVMVLSHLANAQLKVNKIAAAERSAKEAYEISNELVLVDGINESSKSLTAIYQSKGDYKKAFFYLNKSTEIEDTLRTAEIRKNAIRADLQIEYQRKALEDSIKTERERFEEKLDFERKLNSEKQNRNLLAYLAIAGIILALGFYSRYRYIQRSKTSLQLEKDRSDNLLLNILPAEVAEELKIKGESEARDFDNVTVLFTDFQEFTQTAEKLTAKELVGEINTCFKAFDEIMTTYRLEKIKTIGDAYMAAGGLHMPRTSEPKDVVMAAIEMQNFMLERKAEREKQNLPAFDMRVGIHTGPVVAGIVGVKKFQYDIWGDTVNTASRMESHGEVGKVNISQATYELLKDDSYFVFESRGKIPVKGKGEMQMWFVSRTS